MEPSEGMTLTRATGFTLTSECLAVSAIGGIPWSKAATCGWSVFTPDQDSVPGYQLDPDGTKLVPINIPGMRIRVYAKGGHTIRVMVTTLVKRTYTFTFKDKDDKERKFVATDDKWLTDCLAKTIDDASTGATDPIEAYKDYPQGRLADIGVVDFIKTKIGDPKKDPTKMEFVSLECVIDFLTLVVIIDTSPDPDEKQEITTVVYRWSKTTTYDYFPSSGDNYDLFIRILSLPADKQKDAEKFLLDEKQKKELAKFRASLDRAESESKIKSPDGIKKGEGGKDVVSPQPEGAEKRGNVAEATNVTHGDVNGAKMPEPKESK
ncbi:MAG: hypothetical protein WC712_09960 [Candidatus Brocadiia bacterium]